jgi:general stress protein YciG
MTGKPKSKWKETMLKRFDGDESRFKAHMMAMGSKGGSKLGVKKGFALDHARAVASGKIGGSRSRRRPKIVI